MPYPVSEADLNVIIWGDPIVSAEKIVAIAEPFGRYLNENRLKTTQMRGFFATVKRIERSFPTDPQKSGRDLRLLQPKLAYQAKRHERNAPGMVDLANVLKSSIRIVTDTRQQNPHQLDAQAAFQRFVDFFEAILAYHIAAGGD